jgi:GWxTD domain-containing protein
MIRKLWGIAALSVLVLLTAITGTAFASLLNASDRSGDLYVTADYACFKYSDNTDVAFTEIYYGLLRSQLAFQPESDGYSAMVNMFVEIKTDSGAVIDSSTWTIANWIESIAEVEVPNYLINDIIKAQLKPGSYSVLIKASDVNSGRTGQIDFPVEVPQFSDTALSLSQLELVYKVGDADGGNFDKAGRKLIPNTRSVFSHDDNIVYFYAEAYNLPQEKDDYAVAIKILDANGNLYKEMPPMKQDISAKSEVILNGLSVAAFKPGIYKLHLTADAGENSVVAEKTFEVTPGKEEWELARQKEELSDFPEAEKITTEEEAKNFRNQILYIAKRDELKQYDALPLEAKNRFAEVFWQRRDPTPGTPINEFKIKHYERFRYSNEAFSTFRSPTARKNGWRSDRGRVYIEYGPPDDIEHHQSSLDELPWSQWFYNDVQGGVFFIFLDDSGYGNYRLIHSTANSEPKDYNWQSRISPASSY